MKPLKVSTDMCVIYLIGALPNEIGNLNYRELKKFF